MKKSATCPHEPPCLVHSHVKDTLETEPHPDCTCAENEAMWIAPSDRGRVCIRDGLDCRCTKPLLPRWAR